MQNHRKMRHFWPMRQFSWGICFYAFWTLGPPFGRFVSLFTPYVRFNGHNDSLPNDFFRTFAADICSKSDIMQYFR